MPKDYARTERLGEQLRRELADLIRRELKDPRVGLVSLTDVQVSRDLAHAKVFITRIGKAAEREPAVEALNHAAGFLKRNLGRNLHIRAAPNLRFFYDAAVEEGARLETLIDRAVASDVEHAPQMDADTHG